MRLSGLAQNPRLISNASGGTVLQANPVGLTAAANRIAAPPPQPPPPPYPGPPPPYPGSTSNQQV